MYSGSPRVPVCLTRTGSGSPMGSAGTRNSKSPMDIDVPAFKRGGSRHFLRDPTATETRAGETIYAPENNIEVYALISAHYKDLKGRLFGKHTRSSNPYRVFLVIRNILYIDASTISQAASATIPLTLGSNQGAISEQSA